MKIHNYKDGLQAVETLKIENGKVIKAAYLDAAAPELLPGVPMRVLPPHCEVSVELTPTPVSHITVEIWLPTEDWNGDFLGTGNGGSAGNIVALELANGLRRGYATANTDMGTAPDIDDLIGEPERWKDFGYRATHLMTVVGKQVTEAFYGRAPAVSLFIGGSTGGQQALMEAQRYPEDYNGILCIAPAHNRTHLHYGFIWNWLALTESADSGLNAEQALAVTNFLLDRYGKEGCCLPGDRFFTCPDRIEVDPDIFDHCEFLNTAQKKALKDIVHGLYDPVTGERLLSPLYVPGSEGVGLGLAEQSNRNGFAHDFFYLFRWVYGREFDFRKFDFHRDVERLDEVLGDILNATNPDLTAFRKAGGKLLMLHGMADPIIPYMDSREYYERVVTYEGSVEKTEKFFRYFMIPGLGHVAGGPGVQDITAHGFRATPQDREHDSLEALSDWVKEGIAPDRLLAVAFEDGNILNGIMKDTFAYERPCYAYPAYAHYTGGDVNDPSNYEKRTYQD